MNGNNTIQAWLTPALMGVVVVVVLAIWAEVRALDEKMTRAMIRLERHQVVLEQAGLTTPRTQTTFIED